MTEYQFKEDDLKVFIMKEPNLRLKKKTKRAGKIENRVSDELRKCNLMIDKCWKILISGDVSKTLERV